MAHTQIVRHPDLSKLSDKQLKIELQCALDQCFQSISNIRERILEWEWTAKGAPLKQKSPLSMAQMQEDHRLRIERFEHIVEEIKYRRIP